MTTVNLMKWVGTGIQIVGVFALASNMVPPSACFAGLLVGSLVLGGASLRMRDYPITLLNGAFVVSNIFGIIRWWAS